RIASGKRPAPLIRRVELASGHWDDRAEMDVTELTLRTLDRESAAPSVSAPVLLVLSWIGRHPLLGLLTGCDLTEHVEPSRMRNDEALWFAHAPRDPPAGELDDGVGEPAHVLGIEP